MIKRATLAALVVSTAAHAAPKLERDDLPGPQPEVAAGAPKVDLAAVPAFDLPPTEPGFHGTRELRVHGRPVLDTEIKVKGHITWIYDCAAQLASANPKATRAQIQTSIDNDPTQCERPKFYLGDTKDTPRDAAIWVVDVPRPPNKLERDRLPKDQLKAWPAVPKLAVGDRVVVTGTWTMRSPHGERNSLGLLVYKALDPAAGGAAPVSTPVAPAKDPEISVATKAPLRKAVDGKARNASIDHMNACNKAVSNRQFDAAIQECQAATQAWDGNHLAWYAEASAHMAKSEWPQAKTTVERAVTLRPDVGMYQLYYGISLYEAAQQQAREDQARRENKKPDDVEIDPSTLKLDAARDALFRATKLGPDLWRAHYYLGRVYRDLDDAKHAAEQFALAVKTNPAYRFSYIALIELYRKWDYVDQAIAVASLGAANVLAAEAADLHFELGMAYDAKHLDDNAIASFTKVLATQPADVKAKFQRGQIYFRKGDFANAKRDLEDVQKSGDAFARQVAQQLLMQIAAKKK